MKFKVINGGKDEKTPDLKDGDKPTAWHNMKEILESLDLVAEYELIRQKKSRLPQRVRVAVIQIIRMARKKLQ